MIATLSPDLVLLDIQMPEVDGFGVLAQMDPERIPAVIFVTAYDEYALKAFDVHAIDYVLKPVDRDRLLLAVNRAKERMGDAEGRSVTAEQLRSLLSERNAPVLDRIAVKVDGKHVFIAPSSIDWVEAVDDYVRIHIARTTYLVRGTLQSFEKQLPKQFLRIHRSAIVNTERVREISSTPQGDYRLTLQDGTRLPSGRSYRGAVGDFLMSFSIDNK
jgi:two-component system LytT family response regulator